MPRMDRNWNPHPLLVGMWNGAATVENGLAVPQMVKQQRVTTWPSHSIPRWTPQRTEGVCPHRNLYINAHGGGRHRSPEVETTQMAINGLMDKNRNNPQHGWMDIQIVICVRGTILFAHEKKQNTSTSCNEDELWKHYTNWKKPDKKTPRIRWFHFYECPK